MEVDTFLWYVLLIRFFTWWCPAQRGKISHPYWGWTRNFEFTSCKWLRSVLFCDFLHEAKQKKTKILESARRTSFWWRGCFSDFRALTIRPKIPVWVPEIFWVEWNRISRLTAPERKTLACSRLSVVGDEQKKRASERKKLLSPTFLFLSLAFFRPSSTTESLEQARNLKTLIGRTFVRLEFFDDFEV